MSTFGSAVSRGTRASGLRRIIAVAALAWLVVGLALPAAAAGRDSGAVYALTASGLEPVEGASASLQRGPHGISFSVRTTDLVEGHAYTVWFVAFSNPRACISSSGPIRCGMDDFTPEQAEAVQLDVLFGAGHVAGRGWTTFSGRVRAGDADTSILPLFGLTPRGLVDPARAEVHLVVRDHGPAGGDVDGQIHTFDVCNGACADVQAAVFAGRP